MRCPNCGYDAEKRAKEDRNIRTLRYLCRQSTPIWQNALIKYQSGEHKDECFDFMFSNKYMEEHVDGGLVATQKGKVFIRGLG